LSKQYLDIPLQVAEGRTLGGGRWVRRGGWIERRHTEISLHPRIPSVQSRARNWETGEREEGKTMGGGTEHCHEGCRRKTQVRSNKKFFGVHFSLFFFFSVHQYLLLMINVANWIILRFISFHNTVRIVLNSRK